MANKLALVIQEVTANRTAIIDSLNLNPTVFDSWIGQVDTSKEPASNQQALLIISKWIQEMPELSNAHDVIQRVCSPDVIPTP